MDYERDFVLFICIHKPYVALDNYLYWCLIDSYKSMSQRLSNKIIGFVQNRNNFSGFACYQPIQFQT